VITNDYEYRAAVASIQQAEEALQNADGNQTTSPESDTAVRAGIEVQLQKLRARVSQYEALRDGAVSEFEVDFGDLADALTFLRHASGMSQKELAEKLGLKQQQIHRYESQEYEQASFARLQEIVWALGTSIRMRITVPNATHRFDAPAIAQTSDTYSAIVG
jgi:HTH-type transcriptional regulator/antitoxin HipB